MTERDYELLSQYLDGELPVEQAQELRKRLLAEPPLQARFDRLKTVNNRVKSAFDVPGADTVPAHVVQMVQNAETYLHKGFQQKRAGWGMAVAASILVAAGVLLNNGYNGQSSEDPLQFASQDALLSPVLERSLSSGEDWIVLSDGTGVRPLLSFASVQGGWCREYLLSDGDSMWRGVACRSGGQWLTAVRATEDYHGGVSDYRPAGASTSEQIASFIDKQAADIPLSLEQEVELIAREWQ